MAIILSDHRVNLFRNAMRVGSDSSVGQDMKFKFLVFSGYTIWGEHELTREYFVAAAQRDDCMINLEDGTYFDVKQNAWLPIEGDKPDEV